MKKYFTKFLPVKGKIEKGDYFINRNDDETYGEVSLCEIDDFSNYADEEWITNCSKAKLYLCSKDPIEVGDKFALPDLDYDVRESLLYNAIVTCSSISEQVYHFKAPCTLSGEVHSGVMKSDKPYKVIGEVSEDSIWIKENDEFDEEDWYAEPIFDMDLSDEEEQIGTVVKFKCPTCKTYH